MRMRYLDTASLSYDLKCSTPNALRLDDAYTLPTPLASQFGSTEVAWFFAHNASMAVLPIMEHYLGRCGWVIDDDNGSAAVHPVIKNAIRSLPVVTSALGTVRISTLVHWMTGELDRELLNCPIPSSKDHIEIIDAAQAFGILVADEMARLNDIVAEGAIVVGCLQKWLGSPLPLGFALMPVSLLNSDTLLRDHLAARDYLGNAVQPRHGFIEFCDTYSSPLAPVFGPFLRRACGVVDPEFKQMQEVVARNREKLCRWVNKSSVLAAFEECRHGRGILAVHACSDRADSISRKLTANSFVHSIFRDLPANGQTTLRLSAPCVEMDAESEALLASILGGGDE